MTEGSEPSPRRTPTPGKSHKTELLVLGVLLLAVLFVYARLQRLRLLPDALLPPTSTPSQTEMPLETDPPDEHSPGYYALVQTLTAAPLARTPEEQIASPQPTAIAETPAFTEIPTLPPLPTSTPTFGTCQYTLKAGKSDFLYSIYWNWHINQNIRSVKDFYAKITCSARLENMKCNYEADKPGVTQPGWILDLPGVKPEICTFHGGTPLP